MIQFLRRECLEFLYAIRKTRKAQHKYLKQGNLSVSFCRYTFSLGAGFFGYRADRPAPDEGFSSGG
jgi:hypothetical protein